MWLAVKQFDLVPVILWSPVCVGWCWYRRTPTGNSSSRIQCRYGALKRWQRRWLFRLPQREAATSALAAMLWFTLMRRTTGTAWKSVMLLYNRHLNNHYNSSPIFGSSSSPQAMFEIKEFSFGTVDLQIHPQLPTDHDGKYDAGISRFIYIPAIASWWCRKIIGE